MKILTVAFFGHRHIENPRHIERLIEQYVQNLIDENEYVDFLVGRNGDFDMCVSSAISRVWERYRSNNSSLILVLQYPTAEYLNSKEYFHEFYSYVEISDKAAASHPKSAIKIRNKEIADRADLIICYLTKNQGGAYDAVTYCQKTSKPIINISKFD